jgi:DNA-binding IclR family transcriptional regulator
MAHWDFLTNHALVLIHVIDHPRSTLRDISLAVGVTDRAAFTILGALEEDGMISRQKEGRRNRYSVNVEALLSHRRQGPYSVEELADGLRHLSQQASESAAAGDDAAQAVTQKVGLVAVAPNGPSSS